MLRKFNSQILAALACSALIVPTIIMPVPAHALPVFDATNYTQNILSATRALTQIQNQIKSLQNETQSLLNEARNLTKLPKSVQAEIDKSVQATQALMKQAQRVAYDVQNIDKIFQQRYSKAGLTASDKNLVEQARERWSDSIAGFQDALRVQAGIVTSLDTTRTKTGELVSASQDAVGALQVGQAGNQLLAMQLKQLSDLTALMAANGRAQVLDAAGQASARAQAREQFKRFIGSENSYQKSTVRLFRQ